MNADDLRAIKSFPSLVKYLRDELDWPIESDDFDELTFDYSPEELGLDPKTAAKVKEIKQLRPLPGAKNQPWGIFFVNFEPKRLPVVALRRILGHLVLRKRASANKSERPAWNLHDLLFISSYGESDHRDIAFAHFADDPNDKTDLPILRVLGWDDEDTVLHLDHAHKMLSDKLRWPMHPDEVALWRAQWSGAFVHKHNYVIKTSKDLSIQMAHLATRIRKRVNKALSVESETGPLRTLMRAFREALIHDLEADDFADMYAQTITYGLLSARVSRPAGLIAENVVDMVPVTNPFLRDLLSTFLTIGGRKAKIDFDELGINDVVQTLRDVDMEAVLRDFGDRNPQEDPVIHFYELFLKEYDAKKRMQRGVFYTPKPVVSYIVRSVHELLQTEFGLVDGLADMTTWEEMLKKHKELKLPEIEVADPKTRKVEKKPIDPATPFVQILDPATGTATFLVEAIDVIYKAMLAKWKKQGKNELFEIPKLWNDYVPKHLLPRLHGYELMMAPYAIAHMKIGLKLFETGYKFGSGERAHIYLTNALEPPQDFSDTFEQMAPALAQEAKAVNDVKRHRRFTVVIGNPPYSNFGQLNRIPFILNLLDDYKRGLDERKINLDDDFIKFVRFSQWCINNAGSGVFGFITNNIYLGGATHRQMRSCLAESFSHLFAVDLHGDGRKQLKGFGGAQDENVFDIIQGVAVSLFVKAPTVKTSATVINTKGLIGTRSGTTLGKYEWLSGHSVAKTEWATIGLRSPNYFFVKRDLAFENEYLTAPSINEVLSIMWSGIQTKRDALSVNWSEEESWNRVTRAAKMTPAELLREFELPEDGRDWKAELAIQDLRGSGPERELIVKFAYRPLDTRFLYYTGKSKGWIAYPRKEASDHLLKIPNIALIVKRSRMINVDYFCHISVVDSPSDINYLADQTYFMPLYSATDAENLLASGALRGDAKNTRTHNVSPKIVHQFSEGLRLRFVPDGLGDMRATFGPDAIFHYAYGVFHSPSYRSRYAEFLKVDFPRLPLTGSIELFRALVRLGGQLVSLQLLESPQLKKPITIYIGPAEQEVEKLSYANGTVWLDKKQTCGFAGVPGAVWNFHVGGYQVCEKWLKDRKGRTLSHDDIIHYQKIVVALNETIRLMEEIDETIEKHGGWPGAFVTVKPAIATGQQQIEEALAVLYAIALLYTWAKPADRRTFELGMILMQKDGLRDRILKRQKVGMGPKTTSFLANVGRMDEFIGELVGSNALRVESQQNRQLIALGNQAPKKSDLIKESVGVEAFAKANQVVQAVEILKEQTQSLELYMGADDYDAVEIAIS